MASREGGFSSRCISLLEEVKGLLENQSSNVNINQNDEGAIICRGRDQIRVFQVHGEHQMIQILI